MPAAYSVYDPTTSTNVAIGGEAYTFTASWTRPENVVTYGAADVIGIADSVTAANAGSAIHTLTNCGPAGSQIEITDCALEIDLAAVPSNMTTFTVYLYNASPTARLDNVAHDLGAEATDRAKFLGYIGLNAPVDLGSTLWSENVELGKTVQLAAGSSTLYAELATAGAYAPTSGEAYKLTFQARAL